MKTTFAAIKDRWGIAVAALGVAFIVISPCAYGQAGQENPFIGRSDTGQIVHVLPTPASIRSPWDTQPTDAPVSNGTAVYPASYCASSNLSNHGGPEIGNAGFQAIYWNSSVASSAATSLGYNTVQAQINSFVNSFPDSKNWDNSTTDDYQIIQQYGSTTPIAATLVNSVAFVDSQASKSSISDSQIQSYLTSLFNNGKVTPSGNVIYGMYFPSGMKVLLSGGGGSCSSFCGYHNHYAYTSASGTRYTIKYAVFPYLNCTGCSLSGKSVADMLTIVTSHEVREAVTDSIQTAWYDSCGYEADDKCAWHNLYQMTNGGFWVQPEFSNGGTVTASGFTATYPGPGCVVPNK